MSPEADKFRAADAKALLDNKLFKGAFEAVGGYLQAKALGCDPADKDRAQAVVLGMKLLAQIRAEIERHIQDGEIADIRIAALEKTRLQKLFRR